MVKINTIDISPPLINSSCAWSSDLRQLQELYDSSYTGAVTTRTATLSGFKEDASHTVAFSSSTLTSINSYGYSPHPLEAYLSWIDTILTSHSSEVPARKPFIISITSSDPTTLRLMVQAIQRFRARIDGDGSHSGQSAIAVELNTSCPNIPNSPPTGYTFSSLVPLLEVLRDEYAHDQTLTIGLKLPPFVYREQFLGVLEGINTLCISSGDGGTDKCPFAFFTCTNTLGNTLMFPEQASPAGSPEASPFAVPTALGGLAGESLHALSLGNVYTFGQLLREHDRLKGIKIIGVGGVTTKEAADRMRRAGADIVGCATVFGKEGARAFEILTN
ncbi:FMN-linked oxidoreductase [Collybia nuda]|uniref:Dihydroorotate oxidase n=1 Tax=Collybia nuda TaxID=64659 RepID=A0A9P5XU70_9AGAR|nr:FMN-linked oxidoreductase [Collybia nuda]